MKNSPGHILIVDDNEMNREVLAMLMRKRGSTFATAENGLAALELAHKQSFDVVLLDVMMPEMDGFETLLRFKSDKTLSHIPVIMISALDEIENVVRCIGMGATDYLPKPFNAAILTARINSSLASKRLRDLELEYLEQVANVTAAASHIEAGDFDENSLTPVTDREDALGNLARVFVHMAREVRAREQRLRHELEQLKCDIEDSQRSAGDNPSSYVPMDRRKALEHDLPLPDRARGCALFADISGFTTLTETLARDLGPLKGAEEVTRQINRIYDELVSLVHHHGGSAITYGGDAVTCWFDADYGARACACALAMQEAMKRFEHIATPGGIELSLGIKVSVSAGSVRRFLVGDPATQNIEVLAGNLLDNLAEGEHCAARGEILLNEPAAVAIGPDAEISVWRRSSHTGSRYALVSALHAENAVAPWPAGPPVPDDIARRWLLPAVYEKVRRGESEYLSELRPAAALLLSFTGIDYDGDDDAGRKLDAFTRWVQRVAGDHQGVLAQISTGDKGSSMCLVFGAPVAHGDDALLAVQAAVQLVTPPAELDYIREVRAGVAHGTMRAGAYGSPAGRAYGVIGDPINLAARLMTACTVAGEVLCDPAVRELTRAVVDYAESPPIKLKGKDKPVPVFRPTLVRSGSSVIDAMPAPRQITLKVAGALAPEFPVGLMLDVYPVTESREVVIENLRELASDRFVEFIGDPTAPETVCRILNSAIAETAYGLMLFSQRRQLHRRAAEWHESKYAEDLRPHYTRLARHWMAAEELMKAAAYLERAGREARSRGDMAEAESLLRESLLIETRAKSSDSRKAI